MFNLKDKDLINAWLLIGMQILLGISLTICFNIANSILIKRMGIEYMPYSYLALSLFGISGTFIYLMFTDTTKRIYLLMTLVLLLSLLLIVGRILVSGEYEKTGDSDWNLIGFFLIIYCVLGFFFPALNAQIWNVIGDIFRPAQAKQLYPIFSLAWLTGGMFGGIIARSLIKYIGVVNLIEVIVTAGLTCTCLAWYMRRSYTDSVTSSFPLKSIKGMTNNIDSLKEVIDFIPRSATAGYLVVISMFFYLLSYTQDFQYSQVLNLTFKTEESFSEFYAVYSIFWFSTAMILELVGASKLLLMIGVFRGFIVLPLVTLTGFIFLLIQFGFWEGVWLRYSWNVTGVIIFTNAFQLAFNVFPSNMRGRLRGFCVGIANPIGGLIGAIALIAIGSIESIRYSNWYYIAPAILGIIICAAWFFVVLLGRRAYINHLISNLKQPDHQKLLDALESMEERREPAVNQALTSMLLDDKQVANTEVKAKIMEVLSRLQDTESLRVLSLFFKDRAPELRRQAISCISAYQKLGDFPFASYFIHSEIRRLFREDSSNLVRQEAGHFLLQSIPKRDQPVLIAELLQHPDHSIQIMTMQTIVQLEVPLIDMMVVSKLEDSDPVVQSEAIVVLWKYRDYRKQCEHILNELLKEKKVGGLIALIKIGSPTEFVAGIESLQESNDHLIRCLACVLSLSLHTPDSSKWNAILTNLLDTLADPQYDEKERNQFIGLTSYFKDEVVDAILWGMEDLTKEKREIASKGIENIARNMYQKMMNGA